MTFSSQQVRHLRPCNRLACRLQDEHCHGTRPVPRRSRLGSRLRFLRWRTTQSFKALILGRSQRTRDPNSLRADGRPRSQRTRDPNSLRADGRPRRLGQGGHDETDVPGWYTARSALCNTAYSTNTTVSILYSGYTLAPTRLLLSIASRCIYITCSRLRVLRGYKVSLSLIHI